MTKGLTSIIVANYDCHPLLRRITSSCLHNVQKYTDREDYELILVDNEYDKESLDERYNKFTIDKYIFNEKDLGYSRSNNQGAEVADGEYLCFLQNDVFVWEGWLPALRSYLESKYCDIILPHQGPTTREFVKRSYTDFKNMNGNDDAGLTIITREAFDKCGGWDERFSSIYPEIAFRRQYQRAGLWMFCTPKVIITHIGAVVGLVDNKKYTENIDREGKILSKEERP